MVTEAKLPPDQRTIEQLERMLEEAKSGEIQQFYAIGVHRDGTCSDWWSLKTSYTSRVLGRFFLSVVEYNQQVYGVPSHDIIWD